VNLVGALADKIKKFPVILKIVRKNQTKEKREFLLKPVFDKIDFVYNL